jgi:hypothetical protein
MIADFHHRVGVTPNGAFNHTRRYGPSTWQSLVARAG